MLFYFNRQTVLFIRKKLSTVVVRIGSIPIFLGFNFSPELLMNQSQGKSELGSMVKYSDLLVLLVQYISPLVTLNETSEQNDDKPFHKTQKTNPEVINTVSIL